MAYQSLGKLYYGDREQYTQTYQARFSSEDAIRLDFTVGDRQAFFLPDAEVLKLAYEIAKLDKTVSRLSDALPGVAKSQYSRKCLIDEIVLTNNIEGVHSSRKEVHEALELLEKQSGEKGRKLRFTGLVNKYLKLMTGEEIPLRSCQDIRAIYDEVFLEEVVAEDAQNAPDGQIFRKSSTAVHSATDRVIHKGLYPEAQIIDAMEKALAFLGDDSVDRLFRVCIFHYLIEYIHPFYDGNGRLGRLILSYCLSETLEPLLAYRISGTIRENLSAYYKAFNVCNDPRNLGDLTPFLLMLLELVRQALRELEDSLRKRLNRWGRYEALILSFPESREEGVRRLYSCLIQAALFSEKGISTGELEEALQESYYTIRKLRGKIRPELLLSQRNGRTRYDQLKLEALDALLLEQSLQGCAEENP